MGVRESLSLRRVGARRERDRIQRGVLTVAVVPLVVMIVVSVLMTMVADDGDAGITLFLLFTRRRQALYWVPLRLPRTRIIDVPEESGKQPRAPTFYATKSNLNQGV